MTSPYERLAAAYQALSPADQERVLLGAERLELAYAQLHVAAALIARGDHERAEKWLSKAAGNGADLAVLAPAEFDEGRRDAPALLELAFTCQPRGIGGNGPGATTTHSGQTWLTDLSPGDDDGVYLRLVSWYTRGQDAGDPPPEHPEMERLLGKRLRVQLTITEADEP